MTKTSQIAPRVPREWKEDADEMGVTLTEYVKRMARSGRRQWGYEHDEKPDQPHPKLDDSPTDPDKEIEAIIRDTITRNLSTSDGLSEEDLVELITHDLEDQIDHHLQKLMQEGDVEYDPVQGGWVST